MELLKLLLNLLFKSRKPIETTEVSPVLEPIVEISTPNVEIKVDKMLISASEAKTRYGEIKDSKWADEAKWMVVYQVPSDISENWINEATGASTRKIYLNRDMREALNTALNTVKDRNLLPELKTFGGCFCIRDVRGVPGKLSWHSYGLAFDLNTAENGLGKEPKLTAEFVKCFTDAGFKWGGNFSRKDGMHFQLAE